MTKIHAPDSVADLTAFITDAAASKTPVRIVGGGSKLALGNEVHAATHLSTTKLSGIVEYHPDALALTIQAGTPLATIEKTLAKENQRLAFEPADYRQLFGTEKTIPTIGGITACNISGPRRLSVGACRDFLLGVKFVNGKGKLIKNGGKVMKNVTGYDLVKFLCGSYGTLGILTELSFKTAPLPETESTLVFNGLTDVEAITLFADLLGEPLDITGAFHSSGPEPKSLIRIEGITQAVKRRIERIARLTSHRFDTLEGPASTKQWHPLRDLGFAHNSPTLWRLTIKPSAGPDLIKALQNDAGGTAHYDWAGARIWYTPESTTNGESIRALTGQAGGHAMLFKGEKALPAFQPQPEIIARMSENIRAKFDPAAILNPSLMTGEGG